MPTGFAVTEYMFRHKLEGLRQRISALQGFAHDDPAQVRDSLPTALAELQRSVEELKTAAAETPEHEHADSGASPLDDTRRAKDAEPSRKLHFRAIAERSPILVRITGADKRCRWANRAWLEFTGRKIGQLLADGWLEDVHPEDRERCTTTCHSAFDSIRLYRMEYRLRRASGEHVHVLEIGTPRLTSRGIVGGYVGTVIEIAGHARAEQEVHGYQERLRSLMADLLVAEERERRRLAVDLHDGLSQTIALAQIKLSALRSSMDGKLTTALDEIDELIAQTNRTARSISFELSPPVLHDLGLEPAVQWLVENIHARYGIAIQLEDDGQPKPADEKTRVILFRSIRELLINAAKHAGARRVQVCLERKGDDLNASVEDDGAGMDPAVISVQGSGLISIRERLSHVGGTMHIDSTPGQGTKIRLCAPLTNKNSKKARV